MIILARESRGINQAELAKLVGVTQGKISKVENGLLSASEEMIQDISRVLNYPEPFFYEPAQIYPPGTLCHRKRQSLPRKDLGKINADSNIHMIRLQKLLRSAELPENKIPHLDIDEYDGKPDEVARAVRDYWTLPRGPVENVTRSIEDAGGIIIHCNFGTRLIDGFSFLSSHLPPIIFVNKDMTGDRLRFTLAHELGHLVMHRIPTLAMEEEANQFASEFLMPSQDIRASFSNVKLEKLASLKLYWKVSMAALLKRAADLGKITERQKTYLWMQMSKAGYRLREPAQLDIPVEKPSLVRELVDLYLNDLGYTVEELSKVLLCDQNEFVSLYLERNGSLKIVK